MVDRIKISIPIKQNCDYVADVQRIQKLLDGKGFDCSIMTAHYLWLQYCDMMGAVWMPLPEDDEDVLSCISFKVHELTGKIL